MPVANLVGVDLRKVNPQKLPTGLRDEVSVLLRCGVDDPKHEHWHDQPAHEHWGDTTSTKK
jgi:hypothetical protein